MNENKDYLTGILNRKGLSQVYDELDKSDKVSVLFLDLDNFKTVNDVYGHQKGDEVLIKFARILTDVAPKGSIVVRLGGDEYVTLLSGDLEKDQVARVAGRILSTVKGIKSEDRAFEVISASIGIFYDYPVKLGLDGALSMSDKAMYYAKEQGKDTFVFYDEYESVISYESDIEKSAVRALDEGQFVIKYHPVLQMESSRLVGTEACCIWMREDGSVMGRNDYRPVLLKNGFINSLDFFVFRQCCEDLAKIKKAVKIKQRIGVQFSQLLLLDRGNIEQLDSIMEKYGVCPDDFEINFDEHTFNGRTAVDKIIQGMESLRARGFKLALSRFGEDFSCVRYLKRLPFSTIKLDGDFISGNLKTETGIQILKSIVKLGQGFKVPVEACKADSAEELDLLIECGFDATTGEYFCGKLFVDEYIEFLSKMDTEKSDAASYRFIGNLSAGEGFAAARIVGEDVETVKGISNNWGAVSFPGGPSRSNLLVLPAASFGNGSATVSMWIKPEELQNWVSVIYVRFKNGFISFMPNIAGGRCMLRIKDDSPEDTWHDAMAAGFAVGKWTYLCCSVDFRSGVARLYVNGEQEAVVTNIPDIGEVTEVFLGGDVFQMSFHGMVSGLQINKGALEAEEIKHRYEVFVKEPGYDGNATENASEKSDVFVHDPAIFEDKDSNRFYIYGTGAQCFSSMDLIHWKDIGTVVAAPPRESREWTDSDAIWAPDIVRVGNEYRLYCSNSSWGVSRSCIFLAVSDSPKGPFEPRGIVVKTDHGDGLNAIDANIIEDHETGEQYMVYGSFWSGIHLLPLEKETGLSKEGAGFGKLIASRPDWTTNAIEGPYIIYHPETKYYYLFVSYGLLTADYNIRVGRSRNVEGPYLDFEGRDMVAPEDGDCSAGLMVDCGYKYQNGQAYMAPGHNSVLLRENGEMFLVSHIRKLSFNDNPGPGLLQIRKMIMTPDGWPIAMGQPYNAETLLTVRKDLLYGEYERIELRPGIPQGIAHAHPMKLYEDGRLEMASVRGTWKTVDEFTMELEYGPHKEFVHFEKGLDREKNKTSVIMCGLTNGGLCTWATKKELIYQQTNG